MKPVLPLWSLFFVLVLAAAPATPAEPVVVPTAEGQLGTTPGPNDGVVGARFVPVPGTAGDVLLGGIFVFGGASPPPPAFQIAADVLHQTPSPTALESRQFSFENVFRVPPGSAEWKGPGDTAGVFAYAEDGATAGTQNVVVAVVSTTPGQTDFITLDNVPTFPDPGLNRVGVEVDNQGRATVVYTEFDFIDPPRVKVQRIDAVGRTLLGGPVTIGDGFDAGVALLDPAGNRLVIPSVTADVKANIVDFSGGTPTVLPEFPVATTPALVNFNPAVAADPSTGDFTVVWENVVDMPGDPINVRARRFDAMGNPIGNDFIVNTTTDNAQGQPGVAVGPKGETVVVWAGDGPSALEALDVFAQAYDAAGQPIGGEIKVNTVTANTQDRPAVRFLPEDNQGRSRFAVVWRDVEDPNTDTGARGTGTSYRCFRIDDAVTPPEEIFSDGFESGDTSSWSTNRS